jgi:hypothetical protein
VGEVAPDPAPHVERGPFDESPEMEAIGQLQHKAPPPRLAGLEPLGVLGVVMPSGLVERLRHL